MGSDRHIVATFDNKMKASAAVNALAAEGIREDQVSLVVTDEGRGHHFQITDEQTKTAEGVGYGAVLGGLVAGLAAAAIPGSIFIAGPAAALIASAGAGAAAGGLTGGLIGLGIAEDEVKLVEDDLAQGDIGIAVHSIDSDKAERVEKILKDSDAKRVH